MEVTEVVDGGSATHGGVSRIEDRSDSFPSYLLPRRTRLAHWSGRKAARVLLRAGMSSSFRHPTPSSLPLSPAKRQALPPLFRPDQVSTHPTQNCISPYPHYATPRQNVSSPHGCFVWPNRVVQSLVSLYTGHASFLFEFQFSLIYAEHTLGPLICPIIFQFINCLKKNYIPGWM